CRAQESEIVLKRRVVRIGFLIFNRRKNSICAHEPRNIVDVAVSVVSDDTASKPNHFFYTKVLREDLLQVLPRQARIPLLNFAEQALFRGKHQPLAVYIDAAALEDHIMRFAVESDCRRELFQSQRLPDS